LVSKQGNKAWVWHFGRAREPNSQKKVCKCSRATGYVQVLQGHYCPGSTVVCWQCQSRVHRAINMSTAGTGTATMFLQPQRLGPCLDTQIYL
jgi:hypothetical protein